MYDLDQRADGWKRGTNSLGFGCCLVGVSVARHVRVNLCAHLVTKEKPSIKFHISKGVMALFSCFFFYVFARGRTRWVCPSLLFFAHIACNYSCFKHGGKTCLRETFSRAIKAHIRDKHQLQRALLCCALLCFALLEDLQKGNRSGRVGFVWFM